MATDRETLENEMEDWALRAIARWPNVPALFGWLGLDRRGRWMIRGEVITRPQIIETINRNYAVDQYGRWYFQNGPQRGYVKLDYAPLVLHALSDTDSLETHIGKDVEKIEAVYLDEEGSILMVTDQGPGLLSDTSLDWTLSRLQSSGANVDEAQLAEALALPSGTTTALSHRVGKLMLPVQRLDSAQAPSTLHFVRTPQPRQGEKAGSGSDVLLH